MDEALQTLADLVTRTEFISGLVAGTAALGVLVFAHRRPQIGGWGILLTASVALTANFFVARRLSMTVGLVILALGGWILETNRHLVRSLTPPSGWLMALVGASIISWGGGLPDVLWIRSAAVLATLSLGIGLGRWVRNIPNDLVGPLMAISAFGIWATVPETALARVLLGAAIPLALATLKPVHARLSSAGGFALAGVTVWIGAVDGAARPASMLAAWACVGGLALMPLLNPWVLSHILQHRSFLVLGAHGSFVFISSRLFGLWTVTSAAATGIALAALGYFWLLSSGSNIIAGRDAS